MLDFCDFIQVYVFTTNHHLNFNLNNLGLSSSKKKVVCLRKRFLRFLL